MLETILLSKRTTSERLMAAFYMLLFASILTIGWVFFAISTKLHLAGVIGAAVGVAGLGALVGYFVEWAYFRFNLQAIALERTHWFHRNKLIKKGRPAPDALTAADTDLVARSRLIRLIFGVGHEWRIVLPILMFFVALSHFIGSFWFPVLPPNPLYAALILAAELLLLPFVLGAYYLVIGKKGTFLEVLRGAMIEKSSVLVDAVLRRAGPNLLNEKTNLLVPNTARRERHCEADDCGEWNYIEGDYEGDAEMGVLLFIDLFYDEKRDPHLLAQEKKRILDSLGAAAKWEILRRVLPINPNAHQQISDIQILLQSIQSADDKRALNTGNSGVDIFMKLFNEQMPGLEIHAAIRKLIQEHIGIVDGWRILGQIWGNADILSQDSPFSARQAQDVQGLVQRIQTLNPATLYLQPAFDQIPYQQPHAILDTLYPVVFVAEHKIGGDCKVAAAQAVVDMVYSTRQDLAPETIWRVIGYCAAYRPRVSEGSSHHLIPWLARLLNPHALQNVPANLNILSCHYHYCTRAISVGALIYLDVILHPDQPEAAEKKQAVLSKMDEVCKFEVLYNLLGESIKQQENTLRPEQVQVEVDLLVSSIMQQDSQQIPRAIRRDAIQGDQYRFDMTDNMVVDNLAFYVAISKVKLRYDSVGEQAKTALLDALQLCAQERRPVTFLPDIPKFCALVKQVEDQEIVTACLKFTLNNLYSLALKLLVPGVHKNPEDNAAKQVYFRQLASELLQGLDSQHIDSALRKELESEIINATIESGTPQPQGNDPTASFRQFSPSRPLPPAGGDPSAQLEVKLEK